MGRFEQAAFAASLGAPDSSGKGKQKRATGRENARAQKGISDAHFDCRLFVELLEACSPFKPPQVAHGASHVVMYKLSREDFVCARQTALQLIK
jgi:hypothetical protein